LQLENVAGEGKKKESRSLDAERFSAPVNSSHLLWSDQVMWIALMLSGIVSGAPDRDGAAKEEQRDLKIQASAIWTGQEEKPAQRVIRSAEELARALGVPAKDARDKRIRDAATTDAAKLLKVKDIDWSKQMLVVVAVGTRPTGGYRVEITSLRGKDKTLTVRWKLHSPAAGAITTQVITHPSQMVLVERWPGDVRFDPPIDKK
jgi:hypothetical protein